MNNEKTTYNMSGENVMVLQFGSDFIFFLIQKNAAKHKHRFQSRITEIVIGSMIMGT